MAFYDHFAKSSSTRLGSFIELKTKEKEFNKISNHINKMSEILEIGPGEGVLAGIFIKNGYQNFDIVEPNNILRNRITSTVCIRNAKSYLIPNLLERDNSYDLILLSHVFEHLNDCSEAKHFLDEVDRVLKPNGFIFIISPDYLDFGKDFFNVDFSHNYVTTVRRLMELLIGSNLKFIDYKYTYGCFDGILGFLISRIIRLLTFWSRGDSLESYQGKKGNYISIKAYKLKVTFLRNFSIIGKK